MQVKWSYEVPNYINHPLLQNLIQQQSLTKELKQKTKPFSVNLLYLGIRHDDISSKPVFIRDVLLELGAVAVVRARSICDIKSNFWKNYLDCGQQSLGEKLFVPQSLLSRSEFEYALLPPEHILVNGYSHYPTLARRSIFIYKGEQLLLIENFLPELIPLL